MPMKKILFALFLIVSVSYFPLISNANQPDEMPTGVEKPLMVIRFNQPNVYYQLPLYRAIKKALSIYPNAFFQVVSVVPTTGNYKSDHDSAQASSGYATQVTNVLSEMGLPPTRMRLNYTSDSAASYPEVRIFIR